MTPLQRLLGKDDKFYRLLDSSATQAQTAVTALVRLITQFNQQSAEALLGDVDQSRRKHKKITQEITEQLFDTFVTPLEREDIEQLSNALYKITKTVEKTADRLLLCPPGTEATPLLKQVSLLEQAVAQLVKMVAELRQKNHSEAIRDSYERIQSLEGDADRVMNELLRELYHGTAEARSVVFWKDMYELMEKGIDRCRDVGGVLFHIVVKNS